MLSLSLYGERKVRRREGGREEEYRMKGGRERDLFMMFLILIRLFLPAIKGPPSIVTEVVVEHPPLSSSSPPYATTTLERDSTRLQSPPPHPPPPVLSPTPLVSGLALSEGISCLLSPSPAGDADSEDKEGSK